jgi:hypothetical protein
MLNGFSTFQRAPECFKLSRHLTALIHRTDEIEFIFAAKDSNLLSFFVNVFSFFERKKKGLDSSGFEPEASRVQGGRSTGLIYEPSSLGSLPNGYPNIF